MFLSNVYIRLFERSSIITLTTNEKEEGENKEKEINIGFENEALDSCIHQKDIPEKLQDPDVRENVEKCLKEDEKLFMH